MHGNCRTYEYQKYYHWRENNAYFGDRLGKHPCGAFIWFIRFFLFICFKKILRENFGKKIPNRRGLSYRIRRRREWASCYNYRSCKIKTMREQNLRGDIYHK